jgi:hypothetical protein
MRTIGFVAIAMALAMPGYSQGVPGVPSMTAGAEFKGLRFDWEPAAAASWYELEYRANPNSAFTQLGSDLPASARSFRYRLPLHLFDWSNARYRLAACNASGCARSGQLSVSNLRLDAVGFFKASDSEPDLQFGDSVDVTPDGRNFVVAAPHNVAQQWGHETEGAVYVFGRRADGSWIERAKLTWHEPYTDADGTRYVRVSISADGNTVAVGVPGYLHEPEEVDRNPGEVFIFRFDGRSWSRTRLHTGYRVSFGRAVDLDDAGDTLLTWDDGRLLVYRLQGGVWNPVRMISPTPGRYCGLGQLSGDGAVIAQKCEYGGEHYLRTLRGPNWSLIENQLVTATPLPSTHFSAGFALDRTGDTIAIHFGRVYSTHPEEWPHPPEGEARIDVWKRNAGVYSKTAELRPGPWRMDTYKGAFGALALSGDGNTLAVGDPLDNGSGVGIQAPPLVAGANNTGAVYVFRLRDSWRLTNVIKPNYPNPSTNPHLKSFGAYVALNGNGQTLLVTDDADNSAAIGIGGDASNRDGVRSGAVWLY